MNTERENEHGENWEGDAYVWEFDLTYFYNLFMSKLKTFFFLLLFVSNAFAQDYLIEQDGFSANHSKSIYFDMVDATDGYTAKTGLTPTCTILYPSKTSYVSCPDTVTEIATGTYRVRLSNGAEWENLGTGSLYITGTASRPARIKYKVLENSNYFNAGASLVKAPSDLNNAQQWGLTGATATSNSTADYLGYTIADTLTGDGASSIHRAAITNLVNVGGTKLYYGTVEVKSGTLNNIWVGDDNLAVGMDFNTSTQALSTTSNGALRGWRVEALPSSWYRLHWLYSVAPNSTTAPRMTVALGNGTVGTGPQVFTTSGTMIVARAYLLPAESVRPSLIDSILPNISASASGSSVTLNANEDNTNDYLKNREICFTPGYLSTVQTETWKVCSCISAYDGTTKVATLNPAMYGALSSSYKYKIGDTCLTTVIASSVTGNVSGSVGSVVGAVGSVTGAVGSVTGNVGGNVVGTVASVVGAVGSVTGAVGSVTGGVTVTTNNDKTGYSLADSAISAVKMTTDARQAIADTTLRRNASNVESSTYGDTLNFTSPYGMTMMQTGKTQIVGGEFKVYKSNNVDLLNSRTVSTSSAAAPITGIAP